MGRGEGGRGRAALTLLGLILLLGAVTAPAQAPKFFLNQHPLKVTPLFQDGQMLVPLVETARRLGADVAIGEDGALLRWGLGRSTYLKSEELTARGPMLYIELAQLTQTLGVRLLKLGTEYYLFSTPARLRSIRASSGGLIFVFSARVPFELNSRAQPLTMRFFHVVPSPLLPSPVQTGEGSGVRAGEAGLTSSPDEPGVLRLHLSLARAQATVVESEKEFSIWVRPISTEPSPEPGLLLRTESQTRVHEEMLYVQARALTLAGPVSLRYLKISRWQEKYRLVVTLPPDGIGSLAPLDQMTFQALAAINANFFDPQSQLPIGFLMKDGALHSAPYGRRGTLAITLFGNLEFITPALTLSANVLGQRVMIDGLNRPLHNNGLFLYTPRYALPIRSDLPLRAVRLRGNLVLSVSENGLVLPDGESTLLVATGPARSRLGGLRPGDRIEIAQRLEQTPLFLREAISAGPLLLKDSQTVLDWRAEGFSDEFARARAARSVVALTESADLLLVLVLKDSASVGVDLRTLAVLVKALGARDALALDGGSSSSLLFRQGVQLQTIGGRRPIAAGLALVPK